MPRTRMWDDWKSLNNQADAGIKAARAVKSSAKNPSYTIEEFMKYIRNFQPSVKLSEAEKWAYDMGFRSEMYA